MVAGRIMGSSLPAGGNKAEPDLGRRHARSWRSSLRSAIRYSLAPASWQPGREGNRDGDTRPACGLLGFRHQTNPRAAYSLPYLRSAMRRAISAESTSNIEEMKMIEETAINWGSRLGTLS